MSRKILVGLSGGLDSTFAVSKLLQNGDEIEGAVLYMHDFTELDGAKKTAELYGIKLNVIDCRERFEENVKKYFVEEYSRGRTPNPCVKCNRTVKIAALCEYAEENGFDFAATGHYAGKYFDETNGRYSIVRAADKKKDQSYVLWGLDQAQLARIIFPLGDYLKEDIRKEAASLGLEVAGKKESQEICFIPDNDYVSYIESKVGKFPRGNFVDENGKIIGEHKGIIHYTIGQRKGLGMSFGEHRFVTRIDAETNRITLAREGGDLSSELWIEDLIFSGTEPMQSGSITLDAKLRYAAPLIPSEITFFGGRAHIVLKNPARAVTPGQSAVFYFEDRIMFGGIIMPPAIEK